MFTSGTAVPGTAMSSVQEVKAADVDENTVLSSVVEAFDVCYSNPKEIIYGNTYGISKADIEAAIKEELDWDTVYGDEYELEVEFNDSVVTDASQVNATFKVTDKTTKKEATATKTFPVNLITADTVKSELGDLSLEGIASVEWDDAAVDVQNEVNNYISILYRDNDAYKKYLSGSNNPYTIKATAATPVITDTQKIWTVTVTIANNNSTYASKDKATYELEFTVDKENVETAADKAMNLLKEQLTSVEVDNSVSIEAGVTGSNLTAINTAIANKIKEIFGLNGYVVVDRATDVDNEKEVYLSPISASYTSMTEKGIWSGKVTVYSGSSKTSATYVFPAVTVSHKNEDAVIEHLEIVDPETEVDLTATKGKIALSDIMSGIKVTYGDADHTSKVITVAELPTNTEITYDKNVLNTNVGTYTLTFTSNNSLTPVSVSHTVNVVRTTDDFSKVKNITGHGDIVSASSSNPEVATVELGYSSGEVTSLKVKALASGSTDVIVTFEDGTQYKGSYIIKANGTIANAVSYKEITSSARYIWNDADGVGFVADDFETVQLPDDPTADEVATVEKTDLDGNSVFKITPKANGTVTLTVTGGDNGKLTTAYTIKVSDAGVTITKEKSNFDTLKVGNTTDTKLNAMSFDVSGIETKDGAKQKISIDDFGFTSEDKIVFYSSESAGGIDTISATDATDAYIEYKSQKYNLHIFYGSKEVYTREITAAYQLISGSIENSVSNLGLIAVTGVIDSDDIVNTDSQAKGDNIFNAEVKNVNGKSQLVVTAGEDLDKTKTYTATITVRDEFDNEADVTVNYSNNTIKVSPKTTFSFKDPGDAKLTAKTQYEFVLGEDASFEDAYLTDAKDKKLVDVKPYMVSDFSTSESTVVDGKLTAKTANVTYGGVNRNGISYVVRPAMTTVSESALGLPSGESVASVARRGDATISASYKDGTIQILGNKVSQTATVVVTTTKGNTAAIKVVVDENGNISTDITENFKSSFATVMNDVETLGFVADAVETSNEDVAIAKLSGDRITIHSVAPGTASIYAKSGDTMTTIEVTVDEFGTVIIDRIIKATDNGFVRGEAITEGEFAGLDNWYYYIDGEMVTNNWVEVNENGTNVWYHFDKDGKMSRGWIIDESGWKIYNLDSNGRMRKDMWINAAANDALGMPAGLYHLQSDGAVQMNGWAESVTAGIYWYCNAGTGLFEQGNPASWSNSKLW